MGQRLEASPALQIPFTMTLDLAVFATEIGWMGLLGCENLLWSVIIGHATADEVRQAARACPSLSDQRHERMADRSEPAPTPSVEFVESDWNPKLRHQLQQYAAGANRQFEGVRLRPRRQTVFQQRVVELVNAIPYGETMTYGEVAALAGNPGAARAVGTVMSTNPFPIVVPCHRVVASGGKLGGYTSPRGVNLKQDLLTMEAENRAAPVPQKPR